MHRLGVRLHIGKGFAHLPLEDSKFAIARFALGIAEHSILALVILDNIRSRGSHSPPHTHPHNCWHFRTTFFAPL